MREVSKRSSWHEGWPLLLTAIVLAAIPYAYPPAGVWAVGGLFALWILVPFRIKKASADRRSREAVQTTEGMGSFDF